jgi:hypothetical protein
MRSPSQMLNQTALRNGNVSGEKQPLFALEQATSSTGNHGDLSRVTATGLSLLPGVRK